MSKEILAAFNSETGTWDVIDEDDFYDMDKPEEALQKAYKKGRKDGRAEANLDHSVECGDCVRQITAADEARIRADERKKVIDKIRELKKHSGQNVFCTKEYCSYHSEMDCYDCMDAILNYAEKEGEQNEQKR